MSTNFTNNLQGDDCLSQSCESEVENTLSQLGLTEDQLLSSSQEKMEISCPSTPTSRSSTCFDKADPDLQHPSSTDSNLLDMEDNEDDGIRIVINPQESLASSKGSEDNKGSTEAKGAPSKKFPTLTRSQRKQLRTLREKGKDRNEALSIILNKESEPTSSKRSRNDLDKSATEDPKQKRVKHHLDPRERAQQSTNSAPQKNVSGQQNPPMRKTAGISYSDMAKSVKVGIIPKDFPTVQLTTAQLDLLQEALLLRVVQQRNEPIKPKFNNLIYKSGYMVLICKDQETAEWLKRISPSMKPWEGAELMAMDEVAIPRPEMIRAFFPQSSSYDDDRIKALIESQNDITTTNWRIVKRSILKDIHVEWIFTVEGASMEKLKKSKYTLNYRFGEIQLRKITDQPTADTANPTGRPTQEQSEEASCSGKVRLTGRPTQEKSEEASGSGEVSKSHPKSTIKASQSASKGKARSLHATPCSSGTKPKVSKQGKGSAKSDSLTTEAKLAGQVATGKRNNPNCNTKRHPDDPQHPKPDSRRPEKSGNPGNGD